MELIMSKTPSSKNEPKFPVNKVDKKINDAYTKKEVDRLKNLVARQDDQIIQMCDELNEFKKSIEESDEEISVLIGRIENYREIIKTILEITE
jgi:hypothetical protein